jgi:fatty-acyl-CoA synthase
VYVVDRLKDMITTAGENVYPAEIERTLREHPAVDDAAVVGIADPSVGQAPVAFVVTLRSVGSGELVAWCAERLASFKVPRRIRFVEDLPRNPAGKVQKHILREMAAQADS